MPRNPRSRLLLSLPAAVLTVAVTALPAAADPGGQPNGGNSEQAQATHPKKPLPATAKPPAHSAAGGHKSATPPPGRSKGRAPAAGASRPHAPAASAPDAAPADGSAVAPATENNGSKLGKVVVCKYVRKPGVAEVYSHVIVVNANALVGKGFAGTFPFPFSDGQLKSVAIRWAAPHESAREVGDAGCADPAIAPPLASDPVTTTGGRLVIDPMRAPIGQVMSLEAVRDPARAASPTSTTARDALPATGAGDALLPLLVAGALALLGGAWMVLRPRLRRFLPGT